MRDVALLRPVCRPLLRRPGGARESTSEGGRPRRRPPPRADRARRASGGCSRTRGAGIRSSDGLEEQDAAVEHRRVGGEPAGGQDPLDHLDAAAPGAARDRRCGPAQVQGSVGSRSPYSVSARGSVQSLPKSSDSPGSVISSRSPSSRAARSEREVHVVERRARRRGGPGSSRRRSRRRPGSTASSAGWCCRCIRGTAWGRRGPGRRRGAGRR